MEQPALNRPLSCEDRNSDVDGFTKRYRPTRLVWFEHFRNVNDAIACEKKLKGWRRGRKIALIRGNKPTVARSERRLGTAIKVLRPALEHRRNCPRFFAPLRMTYVFNRVNSSLKCCCHVERSETSLVYFRWGSLQKWSEILRYVRNDSVAVIRVED